MAAHQGKKRDGDKTRRERALIYTQARPLVPEEASRRKYRQDAING